LESFAIGRRTTLWAALPDEWSEAWLEIDSSTNATNSREEFYFDAVSFSGTAVPESSTALMAATGLILAILGRTRRRAA
jgi:hypothetical protein